MCPGQIKCNECVSASLAAFSGHHKQCSNTGAKVSVNRHGYVNGWAFWPLNFDPIWIESCDSFEKKESQ